RRRAPDFVKLFIAVPLGLVTSLSVQLSEIWPPPPSLRLVLLAAIAIVAGAGALRVGVTRWRRERPRRSS
ncbi:MAG TPA: hypothetical protein VKO16_05635, partial [Polyangia bacterium]|nr:hypothetical protein [Polyangia bacterium]